MSNPEYAPSVRLDDGQQLIFCYWCVEAATERARRPSSYLATCEPQEES